MQAADLGGRRSESGQVRHFVVRVLLLSTVAAGVLLSASGAVADPFVFTWQELAPGVWAGVRADPFELPQEGNTVLVLTDGGVVVFDAGGSPAMGRAIVAKARTLTDKPITHVILSHWHGDHMRGLQAIQAAWPAVEILAHPHARDRIVETRDRWLKRRVSMVPNIRKNVGEALARDQDLAGRPLIPEEKRWLEQGLANTDRLDQENHATEYVLPTATFDHAWRLDQGAREIQVLWLGAAHTAGDLVMWLPRERVVATGDIVTAPIPLMPSPYVGDYPAVLAAIRDLGFSLLVPGHGPVQRDAQYLDLLSETIRTVAARMKTSAAEGRSRDEALAAADDSKIAPRFTHGDPFLEHRFEDYVRAALAEAAWLAAHGQTPEEAF
ncbi:MAG TPA: MBL fold metallo-hydrolase [Candidatus Polarisedimenticolia bacterium]|nr:MBL fold metallo-hydrolase [Candidatus Polarisedimenticolia bacterium]